MTNVLSCNRTLEDLGSDYSEIVTKDINLAMIGITTTTLLNKSSCKEKTLKLQKCTSDDTDVVRKIHKMICKMKHLRLNQTNDLVLTVLHSLGCRCDEKQVRKSRHLRKRRSANRQKTKKLCKAEAILSAITVCYQRLSVKAALSRN
ncbi:hypothetical protein LDENG_00125220 [Lucifuga dentata]|nr:hypothetical protein LDENG_00125220 [Lucifuga dentata]